MRIAVLNGNADAGKSSFDSYVGDVESELGGKGHDVTVLPLREKEIRQCAGCWSCWVKTPGECVAGDDSAELCRTVINANLVLLASPVAMGYPTALLKNTVDKLLPLIHPYTVVDQEEAHHLARYEKYPHLGLLLGTNGDSDEHDVQIITDMFSRVALNFKTRLYFTTTTDAQPARVVQAIENADTADIRTGYLPPGVIQRQFAQRESIGAVRRLTVFNGSPRGKAGNTEIMLSQLLEGFESTGERSSKMIRLVRNRDAKMAKQAFADAECVLLGFPLYADGMPGVVKSFIESLEPLCRRESNPPIGFLVQSGFPEAYHSRFVEKYLEKLSARLGSPYLGTIVKGNGEATRSQPEKANRKLFHRLQRLGEILGEAGHLDTALLEELARPERLPRAVALLLRPFMRLKFFTRWWDDALRKNGAYERRFARPFLD